VRSGDRTRARARARLVVAAFAAAALFCDAASASQQPPSTTPRRDRPPRKVLIGTVISGREIFSMTLEKRLQRMDELVDAVAAEAGHSYPGKRLDLVVLPETFLARPGKGLGDQALRLDEVRERIAACAKRHDSYLIVPLLMEETDPPLRYSNAAALVDRAGNIAGIYRKVHPVAYQGSDVLEGGTTPGRDFPVFDCDFGRLGIQICFDMLYADGWRALAAQGAEIVALPSASAETVRPAAYARENKYYVVSATPQNHAAFISPLGIIEAQATRESVLVHEIDLSYALIHWEGILENGEALRRRYGDGVGFNYYVTEDMGIFWSNDPKTSIGKMIKDAGLLEIEDSVERIRMLQDAARGGPPATPQ
jgi:predicted amidohydrolase